MDPGTVYLDQHLFLRYLPLRARAQTIWVRDRAQPTHYDSAESPLLVYPSYLKQLSGWAIQQVWYAAYRALAAADRIRVVGASLPEADAPVRALLNPLRFRLETGSVAVEVHDPARPTLE